jgi:hypothetical protein
MKIVRIHEILFLNKDATEGDRPYSQLDRRPLEFHGDLTNLATSFTRRGLVKHLWNPKRSEEQPFGPAPPDSETELMPSGGTLGPGTASSLAQSVEEEPPGGSASARTVSVMRGGIRRLT